MARIAAQLYTLRDYLKTEEDIRANLPRVAEIGYRAVQLSAVGPIDAGDLRELCDSLELEICATHIGIEDILERTEQTVATHRTYGCRHIAIGGLPGNLRNPEGYATFVGMANEAAVKLAPAGMVFSYHNHSFELEKIGERTALATLIEDTDVRVGFEIDTYWIQHGGGDPAEWITKVAGRCPLLHYKDMQMIGSSQKFAPVGQGNLNWERINTAAIHGGAEWIIVEQDSCEVPPTDPFEALAVSFANLRAMGFDA
ncbi:MAG TPA: sugar phosphate isomerase/epimerase [Armatimonadetes bacterium]|nr:sugar phosphate isomerase/epimerase [Armatimonadota bacterium]